MHVAAESLENEVCSATIAHREDSALAHALAPAIGLHRERTSGVEIAVVGLDLECGVAAAAREIALALAAGQLGQGEIDAALLGRYLDTSDIPDPDLIIRTAGEQRLSNYLIWQAAYAEYWFTPLYWPDFDKDVFYEALMDFSRRKRKFGLTADQIE